MAEIAIIGGGPAGLMAAETLASSGHGVTVYDAMPTVGRKFLLAGKSGLNLTHAEDYDSFRRRFGAAGDRLRPALDDFTPAQIRDWAAGLGTETFVGSSQRVFPVAMKASPLLRAWLARLDAAGIKIVKRHRWVGLKDGALVFETPTGQISTQADAVLLALGGASWPRLGSDGSWTHILAQHGVEIAGLLPANCGFDVAWSDYFRERFAGMPVKSVIASSDAGTIQGEFVITQHGVEGSLIYAHAAALRDKLLREGTARLVLDLAPGRDHSRLAQDLDRARGKASFSNRLRKAARLDSVKVSLLKELAGPDDLADAAGQARSIKQLPLTLSRPRPIEEAISSAGGIRWSAINGNYMLKSLPGIFAAGEMLDWEAPTGGYLLTACLATGRAAAHGIRAWLGQR
nr:TIGR03862 family flavoprotein [Phyllobacterium sp. 21LDTY02-6]